MDSRKELLFFALARQDVSEQALIDYYLELHKEVEKEEEEARLRELEEVLAMQGRYEKAQAMVAFHKTLAKKTWRAIGEKFGVSAARVRREVEIFFPEVILELRPPYCLQCSRRLENPWGRRRVCSDECRAARTSSKEVYRRHHAYKMKRYHADEEFRKKCNAASMKWLRKKMQDPVWAEEMRRRQREASRRWQEKKRNELARTKKPRILPEDARV